MSRIFWIPVQQQQPGQVARPIADLSLGAWVASNGGSLASVTGEETKNSADYAIANTPSAFEVQLSPVSEPVSTDSHVLRYEIAAASGVMTMNLRNNGATIASWVHDPAPTVLTTFEQTLTTTQAGNINWAYPLTLQCVAS